MNGRKKQSGAWLKPAIKALIGCAMIVSAGLGFLWLKGQRDERGREIVKKEARLLELISYRERLENHLAELRSPRALDERARELRLGLVPPQPDQIMRLSENVSVSAGPVAPGGIHVAGNR